MAIDWYCRIAGQEFGPLTSEQLKMMVSEGSLTPSHQLKHGKGGSWFSASEVNGLFAAYPLGQVEEKRPPAPPAAPPLASPHELPPEPPPFADPTPEAPPLEDEADLSLSFIIESPPPAKKSGGSALGVARREKLTSAKSLRPTKTNIERGLMIGSALVMLCSAIAGIVIWSRSQAPSQPPESPKPKVESAAKSAAAEGSTEPAKKDDELEKKFAQILGQRSDSQPDGAPVAAPVAVVAPVTPAPATVASPVPVPAPGSPQWTDASQGEIRRGDWAVRILAADTGVPLLVDGEGQLAVPNRAYLVVNVELRNLSNDHRLVYATWNDNIRGMQLTDDAGKAVRGVSFKAQHHSAQGQLVGRETVKESSAIEDRLVFDKPLSGIKFLRLQLAGDAIQEKEPLRFQIPATMIGSLPDPAKLRVGVEKASRSPKSDFGIEQERPAVVKPAPEPKPVPIGS